MAGKQSWAEGHWWRGTVFDWLAILLAIAIVFVLAELLSLRSVLLSVVFQMSKGQAVSEEEMRRLIERADREKHKKAMALLDESGRDGEQR